MHDKLKAALAMQETHARAKRKSPALTAMLNGRKVQNMQYCHVLVRDTAMKFAGEIYEAAMRDNDNNATWQLLCNDMDARAREAEFIKLMWPRMLGDARAMLAQLLGTTKNEALKATLYDALIKDGSIRQDVPKRLFRV